MSCFSTNRIFPVEDEDQIVSAAASASDKVLGGIVLMDNSTNILETLDHHIQYKIRMDVDRVPLSSSLKESMWVPGPDGDMYYNMRYFWGFIQIQDILDSAIMKTHGIQDTLGVYLQQFPYPCFRRDNFNSGMYTTQLIQVALVFGYSLIVGLSVREFLVERETQNLQLMRIMGVKYTAILLANFTFLLLIVLSNSGLLTIIMYYGGMLPYSNPAIVFMVLFTFGIANIMFIFLLSLVLKKSSSGSITSFLIFIITFLPFIIIIAVKEQIPTILKVLANFLMSTSFGFCFLYITRYEQRGEGISWENFMETPVEDDKMSCFICYLILIVDSFLYLGIALFIGKFAAIDGTVTIKRYHRSKITHGEEEDGNYGIHISGLKKVYKIDRKHKRLAVDLEEVTFKENEITGLLGHNGAGKSTTMSMITGMETPTEGSIYINNEASNKIIGYCPQSSILYDNLTVQEHLEFYANLKDEKDSVHQDVLKMMTDMSILTKAKVLSKNLSEGLKRRLSVGIAFIGNSQVVILDEPTSGVDPTARKYIWKLINSHKQNRTILVSTHYIDEAELLCDKIIIMHKGKKIEEGTSLEFQTKFGNDLRLEIFTDAESSTEVTSVNSLHSTSPRSLFTPDDNIDKHIKAICPIVKPSSASHRKRTYTLPSQETKNLSLYQKLFAVLENEKDILKIKTFSIYSPSLEEIFLEILDKETIENIIFNQDKQKHKISPFNRNRINSQVEVLSDIGVPSVSQSPTPTVSSSTASLNSLKQKAIQYEGISLFFWQLFSLLYKRFWNFCGDKKIFIMTFVMPLILLVLAMITAMIRPITETPIILLTPPMYGPDSVSFSSYNYSDDLMENLFDDPGIGTTCMKNFKCLSDHVQCARSATRSANITLAANDQKCSCSSKYSWECEAENDIVNILMSNENTTDTVYHIDNKVHPNKWILNSHNEFIERRYGGWRFGIKSAEDDVIGVTKDNAVVYYNNKGETIHNIFINYTDILRFSFCNCLFECFK